MARSYSQITTAIWRDPDFRALSGSAQRTYIMLISQADISAAGVLPMTIRRWAATAVDTTQEGILRDLDELAKARFVVLDDVSEECLVRSFVRWDGGAANPTRRTAILKAAAAIDSPSIKRALSREFRRLDLPTDGLPDDPSHAPSDDPSDDVRVVVKEVVPIPNPQPRTATLPPSAGNAVALRDDTPTAQTIVAEWIDRCRRRPPANVIGQVSKHTKALLEEGFDPDDIRRGVAAWMSKGLHPSTLPSVVNEVINSGGPAPVRPRQSTADQRAGQALALAQKYAQEGQ